MSEHQSQTGTGPSLPEKMSDAILRGIRWVRAQEIGLVIGMFSLGMIGWGVIELTGEVLEGDTRAIDERLLLAMRVPDDLSEPIGPEWVDEMGRDFTALGGVGVLTVLTLLVGGYLLIRGARRTFWFLLAAVAGGVAASTLLKQLINRPRPALVPHESFVYTMSFPSGHSMMAASTYLTLALLLMQIEPRKYARVYFVVAALVLTVLVGTSRVYLGVHWPSDVLAGWGFGSFWALSCWTVARALRKSGKLDTAKATPKANESAQV
jgi:undecaprenyl-diphosphatase